MYRLISATDMSFVIALIHDMYKSDMYKSDMCKSVMYKTNYDIPSHSYTLLTPYMHRDSHPK